VVRWYLKERNLPLTSLAENPDAAVEVGVGVDVVGALRLQRAQREKRVGGVWVLAHEVVVPPGNRESQRQEEPF